jgi:hypothetical protein
MNDPLDVKESDENALLLFTCLTFFGHISRFLP